MLVKRETFEQEGFKPRLRTAGVSSTQVNAG